LTSASSSTPSTTPTLAAVANDLVHPQVARAAASGVAAAMAPTWPTMPVSCVTNGACLTRNHTATSRSSDVKTIASPAPSMMRAAMPTGNEPANANQNCPTVIRVRPASISRFEPNRSSSTPTGICIAA
jgi:hypothetical protein